MWTIFRYGIQRSNSDTERHCFRIHSLSSSAILRLTTFDSLESYRNSCFSFEFGVSKVLKSPTAKMTVFINEFKIKYRLLNIHSFHFFNCFSWTKKTRNICPIFREIVTWNFRDIVNFPILMWRNLADLYSTL